MKGWLTFLFFVVAGTSMAQVVIDYPAQVPAIDVCVGELREALQQTGHTKKSSKPKFKIKIVIQETEGLGSEGYSIRKRNDQIIVSASVETGLRYGVLELADQVRLNKDFSKIIDKTFNPDFEARVIKFNLPWDPYRESRSMEFHLQTCRDPKFWESYLNMMLKNRFNVLALYNMHPFQYMVKLEKFPDACPFTDQELADWKSFWKQLFRIAKDRGIEVYVVNWNIVIPKSFAEKRGLKHLNDTSAIVKEYTRESVKQVINEYDDLVGIGVTLADWMNNMTPAQREDWIADTFIAGIKSAKRNVKFMHRSVLSGSSDEMRRIINDANFPDPVLVEVKFNWSHGYSTQKLVLTHDSPTGDINTGFWDPVPSNYKIQWMIRNEDFWILRWGNPDFIRQHIRVNKQPFVNGYHIGSEGYIPAVDYFTNNEQDKTWQYAFERQWLFYACWGRLLYDKSTPDKVFEEMFRTKYPQVNSSRILKAMKLASEMPIKLASFFSGTWDYTLYAEGFMAPVVPRGYGVNDQQSLFISIDELIDHKVLDPDYVSIKDFAKLIADGKVVTQKITPLQLADQMITNADSTKLLIADLLENINSEVPGLTQETDDIKTWGLLSSYFGKKLKAGVALQSYRLNGDEKDKTRAIEYLEACAQDWKALSEITSNHYREVPYFKGNPQKDQESDNFSWKKYFPETLRDVEIARNARPLK